MDLLIGRRELMRLSGASRVQCDYWARTWLLPPVAGGGGAGHHRKWRLQDVIAARAIVRLRKEGLSLQRLRALVEALRRLNLGGPEALANPRLLLLGEKAYWIRNDTEALELLGRRPGQLVWRPALVVDVRDVLEDVESRARRAGLREVQRAVAQVLAGVGAP